MRNVNFGSGTDATLLQKLKQVAIAFIDATHLKVFSRFGLSQQQQAATAPTGGTLEFSQVAVRTRNSTPKFGEQPGLEIGRDCMFQTFRFVVDFVPFHSENFGEHALDQVVANGQLAGDLLSGSGQANASVDVHPHQTVFLQSAHGHGYGRGRNFEPVRERGRNDGFPFALGLENRLKVVLFGDGDHVSRLYGGIKICSRLTSSPLAPNLDVLDEYSRP